MDKTLNQETYTKLRQDILSFELKPGDQVSAAKIAERYHVSRTPAREALVRLESEGMVDIYPQSRTVISKINVHRIRQEWFIRRTLELGMAEAFIGNVTEQDIELMRSYNAMLASYVNRPATPERAFLYLEADNDFHAVSYMVAGERLSAKIISNMMAHYNRLRLLIDLDHVFKTRTLTDHERLLDAVERRDTDTYKHELSQHLGHIIQDIQDMSEKYPDYFESHALK
ncbi:MAG: GntR family transcriptional regulator [Lachnospiraceae bacterium]|jgi:DNA-binding GntR family transcriptional regulator|nr:GntR family transcriptional regulator [Lachnospiraceae bacterium]